MNTNIIRMYEARTQEDYDAGMCWYPEAKRQTLEVAYRYDVDPMRAVWALAALSPRMTWNKNILALEAVVRGDEIVPGATYSNIVKAKRILAGDLSALSGNKVNSFARCIWGDPDDVVVDTWTWRIGDGVPFDSPPPKLNGYGTKLYHRIADEYRELAPVYALEPRQLQAITWETIRRLKSERILTLDMLE